MLFGIKNPLKAKPKKPPYTRMYIGTVVDNNDPEKCQRLRVRVAGVYNSSTLDQDLPWSIVVSNSMLAGSTITKSGVFGTYDLGALVYVSFQDNDPSFPLVLGSALVSKNTNSKFDTNYPNRYGFADMHGNDFIVDPIDGTLEFTHQSGNMTLLVESDGKVKITSPNIDIGTDSPQPIVLGNNFKSWVVSELTVWLNTHIHKGVTSGAGVSGLPEVVFNEGEAGDGGDVYSTKNRSQ